MAARSRQLAGGRDHDKKDLFTPSRANSHSLFGRLKALRRRRVLLALLATWLLYLFIKNMPEGLPPVPERYDRRYGRLRPGPPDTRAPEPQPHHPANDDYAYEGPIKFYDLATTLHEAKTTADYSKGNVLFTVSKLTSIPRLVPFACSMAQYNRTRVHLAFMGRQRAEWKDIRASNGISDTGCDILLHDARPDFSEQSSEGRLTFSASAALGHLHSALQLGAVFTDEGENSQFVNSLKEKGSSLGVSLITLPAGGLGSVSWMSSLDASSLAHFNNVHVDIIIQAHPESSGSLLRLLRSIKDADYSGWALPRLIIELPVTVDPFLEDHLSKFRWPPDRTGSESKLVIRRRLDTNLMSPVQASIRTVESFYPLAARDDHVLFLSSKAELSRGYFHLLMYMLLEYRYGAGHRDLQGLLVGFSLDLPTQGLDLRTKAPWATEDSHEPLMLWQAPASNAAVYFGHRWVEFHSFLNRRLLVDPELAKTTQASPSLSHEYPSWLHPMLEMMQTHGYYLMYPTFVQKEGSAVVTIHQELAQVPEEYLKDKEVGDESSTDELPRFQLGDDQALTADDEIARLMRQEQNVHGDSVVSSLLEATSAAVREGNTAAGSSISLIAFDGEKQDWQSSQTNSRRMAAEFALSIGGCKSYDPATKGDDFEGLFCLAS